MPKPRSKSLSGKNGSIEKSRHQTLNDSVNAILNSLEKNPLLLVVIPVVLETIRKGMLYAAWVPLFVLEAEPPLSLFAYATFIGIMLLVIVWFHVRVLVANILLVLLIAIIVATTLPFQKNNIYYISKDFQVIKQNSDSVVYSGTDFSNPFAICKRNWLVLVCQRLEVKQ